MARIAVYINEKDVTLAVDVETLSISDSLKIKSDSLNFDMVIEDWAFDPPRCGNRVMVIEEPSQEVHFAGLITEVSQKLLNPITYSFSVSASDWTKFFDRVLISEVWKGELAEDLVRKIVEKVNEYTPNFFTTKKSWYE